MSDRPFYDLVRDASEEAHALASALRQRIKKFREEVPETTDKDVADAIRLIGLKADD